MECVSRIQTCKDVETSAPRRKSSGGSKLARRARSFKDDFLDILAAMRSPSSTSNGSRSSSPKFRNRHRSKSPKQRLSSASDPCDCISTDNPLQEVELHVRQVQFALRHFQDVISKNKLEVVPGNGTVVLEMVANIHSVIKPYSLDEQSSDVVSGLNQMYQSVAKLIKLCDDVLISGEKALSKDYVSETIRSVEDAVQGVVSVAAEKFAERDRMSYSGVSVISRCSTVSSDPTHYRVSLPDIPLTPRELQILQQTSYSIGDKINSSHDCSDTPPRKPPLPVRSLAESPPPLPPKRRVANTSLSVEHSSGGLSVATRTASPCTSLSLERLSLKSDGSSVTSWESTGGAPKHDGNVDDPLVIREQILPSSTFVYSCNRQLQQSGSCSTVVDGAAEVTAASVCQVSSSQSSQVTSVSSSLPSDDETPPALPVKTRKLRQAPPTPPPMMQNVLLPFGQTKNHICKELSAAQHNNGHSPDSATPPPLPLKKKHIMAYMEMFGNCSHGNTTEFLRHSVHTYSLLQAEWQQHHMMLNTAQSCSFDIFSHSSSQSKSDDIAPALPPKRSHYLNNVKTSQSPISPTMPSSLFIPVPPPLPPLPRHLQQQPQPQFFECNELKPEENRTSSCSPVTSSVRTPEADNYAVIEALDDENVPYPLAELDVTRWVVYKRAEEDGPDIRGGHPDALVVLATKANKNDFLYQEAFLTTYRTFIDPSQLIGKLMERYRRFDTPSDATRQRAARESFSLLVRTVGDLTFSDLDLSLVETLMDFVYQLLCNGDLIMGKALRVKLLEKYLSKLRRSTNGTAALSSQHIYTRQATLLDFKSEHIAEQMTLLDAELFMNIEIPEVLMWVQEQNEEKSPNLTLFTEHFNKMSYWARSRILEQDDAKDRERYVLKFIKIMKHLRKMNNFNSYLALLSALDSAPIRRLEWQKHITEGLKEYCALIDSSSSFRAYRQALAETQPPCIPYIGLVLQDLTFVHIGNSDYLSDGIINFSKRWQQFNIVENMKRFQKTSYNFKNHDRIIAFFSNFDEFLCEEAMWQISESIKPRGGKKN